uniref:Uncharacterized protein n=1 Tax=Meloidogyne incognita TaxID=6306 RepID=A0A914KKV1_MELIC
MFGLFFNFLELENVLKLEKESLAAVENELAKLKIQVDQQLNEYNLKRDEILGLVLNDNDKENNEISISERDIMEPVVKNYLKDLKLAKTKLLKQQKIFDKFT